MILQKTREAALCNQSIRAWTLEPNCTDQNPSFAIYLPYDLEQVTQPFFILKMDMIMVSTSKG